MTGGGNYVTCDQPLGRALELHAVVALEHHHGVQSRLGPVDPAVGQKPVTCGRRDRLILKIFPIVIKIFACYGPGGPQLISRHSGCLPLHLASALQVLFLSPTTM